MKPDAQPFGHRSPPLPPLASPALLPADAVGIVFALAARFGSARRSAIPVYARAAASGGRYGVATPATRGGARR